MAIFPDPGADILEGILASILGFLVYLLFSHPKYLKKKVPSVKFGSLELRPSLKLRLKHKTIHIHHWIWLTALLGFLNHIAHGIDNLLFLKLFAAGGIVQGFTFKDRFHIFIKNRISRKTNAKNTPKNTKLGIVTKLAIYTVVGAVVLVSLFGNIFAISPVKAEVAKGKRYITNRLLPNVRHTINSFHDSKYP